MARKSDKSGKDRQDTHAEQVKRFIEAGKTRCQTQARGGGARILALDWARRRRAVRRVKAKDPDARDKK